MKIFQKSFFLSILCISSCLSARCESKSSLLPQLERVVAEFPLREGQNLRVTGEGKAHEFETEAKREEFRRALRPGESVQFCDYQITYKFFVVDKKSVSREIGFAYIGSIGVAYPSLKLWGAKIVDNHLLMLYNYGSYISNGPQVARVPLQTLQPTDLAKVDFSLADIVFNEL